jgi:hypothetical protein
MDAPGSSAVSAMVQRKVQRQVFTCHRTGHISPAPHTIPSRGREVVPRPLLGPCSASRQGRDRPASSRTCEGPDEISVLIVLRSVIGAVHCSDSCLCLSVSLHGTQASSSLSASFLFLVCLLPHRMFCVYVRLRCNVQWWSSHGFLSYL